MPRSAGKRSWTLQSRSSLGSACTGRQWTQLRIAWASLSPIFRLYGTKKDLFVAAALRVCQRIQDAFEEAARRDPEHALRAMGDAYQPLLSSRAELLVLLHAFAASEDQEVRKAVSSRYEELWKFVAARSGAGRAAVAQFFADGMGITVGAALGLEHLFEHEHALEDPD